MTEAKKAIITQDSRVGVKNEGYMCFFFPDYFISGMHTGCAHYFLSFLLPSSCGVLSFSGDLLPDHSLACMYAFWLGK